MYRKRRVGIGGIATESCTFFPLPTTIEDFAILRGNAMQSEYPYLPSWTWQGRSDIEFIPCLKAWAAPGGEVTAETYAGLKAELLKRVEAAMPLDGLFLDLHGAMSVVGLNDAELDLVTAIRELVGPGCVLSAGMDLHGNITEGLVALVDVFTCYRHAPHIDALETKERAVSHLVHLLDTGIRPHRAFLRIPVMLPGERTSTVVEPGKTVYGRLAESDAVDGVIDPSLWVGYVWADQRRTGATVVVTGTDTNAISSEAETIARRYWDARHDFGFEVPAGEPDWVIDEALKLNRKAVFISDAGDNMTAGAAGDLPLMTSRLLAREEFVTGTRTAIVAGLPAEVAVQTCTAAGIGNVVTLTVGGVLDPVNGEPLTLAGTVRAILRDDPVGGDSAVVQCGGVFIALTTRRKVFFELSDFEALGLHVAGHHLIVVKVGYLFPGQRALASAAFLALTPGAVNLDIPNLPYHRVQRPIYPLDPQMPEPDFTPVCFGPITEESR